MGMVAILSEMTLENKQSFIFNLLFQEKIDNAVSRDNSNQLISPRCFKLSVATWNFKHRYTLILSPYNFEKTVQVGNWDRAIKPQQ